MDGTGTNDTSFLPFLDISSVAFDDGVMNLGARPEGTSSHCDMLASSGTMDYRIQQGGLVNLDCVTGSEDQPIDAEYNGVYAEVDFLFGPSMNDARGPI